MRADRLTDPAVFLERAGALLRADEARHNLILSLAHTLIDSPGVYPEFSLWVVSRGGNPVAAALITPPQNLVLADETAPGALGALAAAVAGSGIPVPGAVGTRPTVDRFSRIWAELTGAVPRLAMAQGVFSLERVEPVPAVPGAPRPASPADRALVLEWMGAFTDEVIPHQMRDGRLERGADRHLDPGTAGAGVWLWEDGGRAVSLAGYDGAMPPGIRVGPVYTPPPLRRRGYGTALVAALSSWLLERGHRRCFLYTDLANPTSNAIYRRIGYVAAAESAEYAFES